jgi:hypothetical protein
MLAGVTKAIDPMLKQAKERLAEACAPLRIYKNLVTSDKDRKAMFTAIGGYAGQFLIERGQKGSEIVLDHYRKMDSAIMRETLEFLEDVRHRSRAYTTHITRYSQICYHLAKENKMLFKKIKLTKK